MQEQTKISSSGRKSAILANLASRCVAMTVAVPKPEDRPLSAEEVALVRWLLEHGNPDSAAFLPQLAYAKVISRCPCGCASIDFSINGMVAPAGAGMQILADYQWQTADGAQFGVFVFVKSGLLAGLEVWSLDGLAAASTLPAIDQLEPLRFVRCANSGDAAGVAGL